MSFFGGLNGGKSTLYGASRLFFSPSPAPSPPRIKLVEKNPRGITVSARGAIAGGRSRHAFPRRQVHEVWDYVNDTGDIVHWDSADDLPASGGAGPLEVRAEGAYKGATRLPTDHVHLENDVVVEVLTTDSGTHLTRVQVVVVDV